MDVDPGNGQFCRRQPAAVCAAECGAVRDRALASGEVLFLYGLLHRRSRHRTVRVSAEKSRWRRYEVRVGRSLQDDLFQSGFRVTQQSNLPTYSDPPLTGEGAVRFGRMFGWVKAYYLHLAYPIRNPSVEYRDSAAGTDRVSSLVQSLLFVHDSSYRCHRLFQY